jgi:hypothetical protein
MTTEKMMKKATRSQSKPMSKKVVTQKNSLLKLSTAEAFYRVFRALPKKERVAIARYILTDEEVQNSLELSEVPNEITVKAFTEDKQCMPVFSTIDELRKDLLS